MSNEFPVFTNEFFNTIDTEAVGRADDILCIYLISNKAISN